MLGVLPRPPLIVEKIWKAPVVHLPVPPSFLYVSSYCGHVTTLDVRPLTHSQCDNKGPFRLNQVSSTYTGGNPSFLTIDKARSTLYCLDEGLTSTCGSLASFRMNQDGSLALLDKKATPGGPVSGALYHRGKMLAVAHYADEAITTWNVWDPQKLRLKQTRKLKPPTANSYVAPQDVPRPQQVMFDPTGQFAVVPDLGCDRIRIYRVPGGGKPELKHTGVARVKQGSGPRHGAFAVGSDRTYLYILTELSNEIIGFKVHYRSGTMKLQKIFSTGIHGKKPAPEGASASEIIVTPDNKSVIVASRNENSIEMPHPDPENSAKVQTDPLIHFSINSETGQLTMGDKVSCGGSDPRQFSISKAGTLLAVALQKEGRVAVMRRDVGAGGLVLEPVGNADVGGQVTSVVFDE